MKEQRKGDFDKMKEKFDDIARDEKRRAKDILKEHQEVFKKPKSKTKAKVPKTKSIDFYEK
jgi:hypothetical protein